MTIKIEQDSIDICHGLIDGYAISEQTGEKCFAETSTKEQGPFYCQECFSDVVLRKCSEKKDHFAHTANLSPIGGEGRSILHKKCQEAICSELSIAFPNGDWKCERNIKENKKRGTPQLRPDISGRLEKIPLVIEVQASSLTINEIIRRTIGYTKWNVPVLWVVPLTRAIDGSPFKPRLFERYLHSMYYGRVYYWWNGLGKKVQPVHFGIASRTIEYKEFYDKNGCFQQTGGYKKPYKLLKEPIFGEKLDISKDFKAEQRPQFCPDNLRKVVPKCRIWVDKSRSWW